MTRFAKCTLAAAVILSVTIFTGAAAAAEPPVEAGGYTPLEPGTVRVWDLGRKYTYKHYWPKKQWEDRRNWVLVPHGRTKGYTFRGDCMLEGPNFWLSLHSSTHDACFLYAKKDE